MKIGLVNFISQFTTDILHIAGAANQVDDTLSRMEEIQSPDAMDNIPEAQATSRIYLPTQTSG